MSKFLDFVKKGIAKIEGGAKAIESEVVKVVSPAVTDAKAFLGREVDLVEAAILFQARKDVPGLTAALWTAVKTEAIKVTEDAMKNSGLADGGAKWTAAVTQFVKTLETEGIAGIKMIFSTGVKESLLQEGYALANAGLSAIASTALKVAVVAVIASA